MRKPIRQIRIEDNIAFVPLTQGKEAVIDAADVPLVDGWNWHAMKDGNTFYAARNASIGGKRRMLYLHRAIMGAVIGSAFDHIDGDGLNNRRSNLRLATHVENGRNSRTPKSNTSGFKGVGAHKKTGRWYGRIRFAGKAKYLGTFDTPEEAHAAYCAAAKELHGEFARTE